MKFCYVNLPEEKVINNEQDVLGSSGILLLPLPEIRLPLHEDEAGSSVLPHLEPHGYDCSPEPPRT